MLICSKCGGDWSDIGRQYSRQDSNKIDYYCAKCQCKRKPQDNGFNKIQTGAITADKIGPIGPIDIDEVFDIPIGDFSKSEMRRIKAQADFSGLEERVEKLLKKAKDSLKPEPNPKLLYDFEVPRNILMVGDIHEPFCLDGYREFCYEIYQKWNCDHVIFMGDVIDSHYSSFHNTDPDGLGAGEELEYCIRKLAMWKELFPKADVCLGNHDLIILRKAFSSGLSKRWVRDFHEVLEVDWNFQPSFVYNNTLFRHGLGQKASPKAGSEMMNVVQGHFHTESYIHYRVGRGNKVFGMQVPCVDGETEFLTPKGWKRITEYSDGDLVAQFDTKSESATFVKPTHYIKTPCEDVYHIENQYGLSQKLSEDHNVLYRTRSGDFKKIKMNDLFEKHNVNVDGFERELPCTFDLETGTEIPLTNEEIRVQVMYMADGSYYHDKFKVDFKKVRKIQRAERLLNDAGINFEKKVYDEVTRFIFTPPVNEKVYGDWWYKCSPGQFKVVCDEVMHWDGDLKRMRFTSKHKSDADFIQLAFNSVGKRTSITVDNREGKRTYNVNVSNKTGRTISQFGGQNIKVVPTSDGFVYCFEVEKGNLILRHNDSIFVTGNCGVDRKTYALAYAQEHPKEAIGCAVLLDNCKTPIIEMMEM